MSSSPVLVANPFSEILQATFEALTGIDNDIRCANPIAQSGSTTQMTIGGTPVPIMGADPTRIEVVIYNEDTATTLYVGYQRTVSASGSGSNAIGFPIAPAAARLYDRHTAPLARWAVTTGAQIQVSVEALNT